MQTKQPSELPAASLFFQEGGSDKEYHARIERQGAGFVVAVAWGRRGGTLQTGLKTQGPVSMAEASAIFQRVVAEKEKKGYRPVAEPSGSVRAAAHATATAARAAVPMPAQTSAYRAQLCNPIEDYELDGFVARLTDQWCAQEKYDGKRVLLVKNGSITALNRDGKPTDVAPEIVEYATRLTGAFVLDGEAIGPDYYAFDILRDSDGNDLRALPYGKRYQVLKKLVGHPNGWPVHIAPLVTGRKAVEKFVAELRAANKEGVVFKDLLAPYTPDRPNRGGPWRKFKFCATCSAVVIRHNDARSVGLALYINATEGTEIGNVTIPPNHAIPAIDAVVEVRYLYYFEGGSLYQPVYQGERDDVPASDCTMEKQKLKRKAEPTADTP